jgi:hypothetical protein
MLVMKAHFVQVTPDQIPSGNSAVSKAVYRTQLNSNNSCHYNTVMFLCNNNNENNYIKRTLIP